MVSVIKSMNCITRSSLFVRLLDTWLWPAAAVFTFNFHRKTLSRSTPIKNEAISLGNDLHK